MRISGVITGVLLAMWVIAAVGASEEEDQAAEEQVSTAVGEQEDAAEEQAPDCRTLCYGDGTAIAKCCDMYGDDSSICKTGQCTAWKNQCLTDCREDPRWVPSAHCTSRYFPLCQDS